MQYNIFICASGHLSTSPVGLKNKLFPSAIPFLRVADEEEAKQVIMTIGKCQYAPNDHLFVWGLDSRLEWKQDIMDISEVAKITKEVTGLGEIIGGGRALSDRK